MSLWLAGELIVNPLCSYLTAGMLLVHAVLGCCWHHAHAVEKDRADRLSAAVNCGCSHAVDVVNRAAHSQPADHDDDPHDQCDHITCSFLSGEAPVQPAVAAVGWFDVAGDTAQVADHVARVTWQPRGYVWLGAGTLRTHLVFRVLLI